MTPSVNSQSQCRNDTQHCTDDPAEAPSRRGTHAHAQQTAILHLMGDGHQHFSARDVADGLGGNGRAAQLASVYRNLKTLVDAGLIHRLQSNEKGAFFRACSDAPHGHVRCRHCRASGEVPVLDVTPALTRKAHVSGYSISHISMELVGVCAKCRAESVSDT